MKNRLLTFLLLVCFYTVNAQIPKEAFDLTNNLYNLWQTSPKDKAVEASIKLNKLYQPFLIDNLHHSLAQAIRNDRSKGYPQEYLQAMWDLQDASIRSIIEPMYVWNQSFDVNSLKDAENVLQTYFRLLKDSTDMNAKTELYGLLILKNLESKKLLPADLQAKVLEKIIGNLQKYPYLDKAVNNQVVPRAWHRYLLAYSMHQKFRTQGERFECLQAASKYSPDLTDMQRRDAYNYDAYLLEGDNRNVGFQSKYIQYLDKNKRYSEVLDALLEKTFGVPVNANLQTLKDFLAQHSEMGEFKNIWSAYVDGKMQQAPTLQVTFDTEVFDFSKPRANWTFIDVWGTWCSPCVKELPHLNQVAATYNGLPESKIRIRTFSYHSIKLLEFMETNKYTFPVTEVAEEVTKPFGITSYPTKLLISPNNKYLVIPFNVNWEEYMRNYCLVE